MTTKRRRRHTPEQIVRKLRDAEAMLNAGKEEAVVLQTLEVSQSTYERWRAQYGGMKAEAAKRLKELEDENKRLKEIVAEKELDIRMLKHLQQGNCRADWPALGRGPCSPAYGRGATAGGVRGLGASSVRGGGPAAQHAALRVGTSGRRVRPREAEAAVGAGATPVRRPPDRMAVASGRLARQRYAGVSPVCGALADRRDGVGKG